MKRWTATRTSRSSSGSKEEPAQQGAWPRFGLRTTRALLPDKLAGIKQISRRAMSAPSSGSSKVRRLGGILDEAFSWD